LKLKWKIILGIVLLVFIGAGIYCGVRYSTRGIVAVQTGRVVRQDLVAIVTASGEIKPRNYVDISANAMGRITEILVKEGDRVHKGQLLARIESIQPQADVAAQKAALSSAEADSSASEAGVKASEDNLLTLQATIDRARADLEHANQELQRGQQLYDAKLIARQDYEQRKTTYDSQRAALREAETRLTGARAAKEQTAAQLASAQKRIAQNQAMLTRLNDVLDKHYSVAPLDGMVTNLPVRAGETAVTGIQNTPGSLLMTIADMSLITAEVKVDETDIVNVKLNQKAGIMIDAIPNRVFEGHVIEIGNTAILRSTGLAASQSTISSQEAKDFKVVIAMDNPPEEVRPGLSCTAKVTTASRSNSLTAPIQALTVRQKSDLESNPAPDKAGKEEVQGVFVISGDRAVFRKVETGITGSTDIEILSGLNEGDQIVTGSFKVIRTLRNQARIKVESLAPA
jgi:HlyD family secretion protein